MLDESAVLAVVDAMDFGKASAAKRGRRKEWPYVPIIDYGRQRIGVPVTRSKQVMGQAYATRDEAIDAARKAIEWQRNLRFRMLLDPRQRALRQQWNLPTEI